MVDGVTRLTLAGCLESGWPVYIRRERRHKNIEKENLENGQIQPMENTVGRHTLHSGRELIHVESVSI